MKKRLVVCLIKHSFACIMYKLNEALNLRYIKMKLRKKNYERLELFFKSTGKPPKRTKNCCATNYEKKS